MSVERQELWCHDCQHYVQFDLDMELNGNHVLHCPNCGHEHCRVVENGRITSERWDHRNGNIGATHFISSTATTFTTTSTFDTSASNTSVFLYSSWMNTTGTS